MYVLSLCVRCVDEPSDQPRNGVYLLPSVDIFGRSKQFSCNGLRKSNMGRASYVRVKKETLLNRIRRFRRRGTKEVKGKKIECYPGQNIGRCDGK